MGLDMYAYAVKGSAAVRDTLTDYTIPDDADLLHQWRKHHDLHGWMEKLYRAKNGKAGEFNCVSVQLTGADLDALAQAVRRDGAALPPTTGFFFGNNPPDARSRADDLAFIAEARRRIKQGDAVFYSSWW